MAEVSSVDFDDLANFEKTQEICRFYFERSTYCLVLGPRVKFNPDAIAIPSLPPNIKFLIKLLFQFEKGSGHSDLWRGNRRSDQRAKLEPRQV